MWTYPEKYDVIVIGAGHAGCEAAYIASKKGVKTLLITMNLDTIAKLSCNPSIGGIGKGHIVKEIDALGGIMGKMADKNAIHYRMLNASKGKAVQAPRAQIDKAAYHIEMKLLLEKQKNLDLKQGKVTDICIKKNEIIGIQTEDNVMYLGKTVILCSGTFIKGSIFIGDVTYSSGRVGDFSSFLNLEKLGIEISRLKTGTPPRICKKTIDFSKMEAQISDEEVQFSFDKVKSKKKILCYITYTTKKTKEIIQKNLKKSALFSGKIKSAGPRYCPSIEDKILRFPQRDRHQIFLEPEGLKTQEFYVNGISTSFPIDIQLAILQSIKGLENAKITRPAYAIEYDYVKSGQITSSLESKKIKNLFFAGQINGTTGYEEAAAQGLIAGINAFCRVIKKEDIYITRSDGYIGVMIDDLITKDLKEPYRMFTSRAEHRLFLRQDNADIRLFEKAFEKGLISYKKYQERKKKKELVEEEKERFQKTFQKLEEKSISLHQILSRPDISYKMLQKKYPKNVKKYPKEIEDLIETEIKYSGYLERQKKDLKKLQNLEKILIPKNICYDGLNLRKEAKENLKKFSPKNLSIASRIQGVTSADIFILMVAVKKCL